jgi:predicted extracellular nuclease
VVGNSTVPVALINIHAKAMGDKTSYARRKAASLSLKALLDGNSYNTKNVILLGDFNDYPDNKSMLEVLGALPPDTKPEAGKLYNLMYPLHKAGRGSHKHNGEWGALDQIIVSGGLLNMKQKVFTTTADAQIFEAPFLLEEDKNFLGKQPARTYVGMTYKGGFSDHLPVFVDLWY